MDWFLQSYLVFGLPATLVYLVLVAPFVYRSDENGRSNATTTIYLPVATILVITAVSVALASGGPT